MLITSRGRAVIAAALIGVSGATAAPASDFKGDVDGDYRLDVKDLRALRGALDGALALPPDAAARADVDDDGLLTEADFSALTFPALDATSVPPFGVVPNGTPVVHAVTPDHASAGSMVVVEGDGFGVDLASNEVRVGDVEVALVSAAPDRIEFVVPDVTGVVSVTNLQTGHRGLSASFVVAETAHPALDPSLPEGSVLLVTPDEVLLPNAVFTVPLALSVGDEMPAVFHVKLFFDNEHVEAVCVEPVLDEWFTPLPPCIDNAAGVLGAGALQSAFTFTSPSAGPVSPVAIFEVGFRVKAYRPHAPVLTTRVEVVADASFPAAPLGAPTPRYAADTAQLHPEPVAPHWIKEWSGSTDDLPSLTAVTSRPSKTGMTLSVTGTKLGLLDLKSGACLVTVGGKVAVPSELSASGFLVKTNGAMQSGPVVFIDLRHGRVSNDLLFVLPEAVSPELDWIAPDASKGPTPVDGDVRLGFSEALDGAELTYGRMVRLLVTAPGESMRPWSAAVSSTTAKSTTMRFRPLLPFPAGATVRVELDPAVTDLSGNRLAPPYVSEFVVAP